ncbi:hypothetical protein Aspvir_007801 [Aspergillus viridinutans]|uniref:Uncharacterized protein n=1 Tax=Aspergillus viridinutans TaxID=75553 RepID=A0A9P3BXC5_ASPVI|nr:uncharacterized protein Aspvir_007801 [Aspergillus viridinutans]GIK03727.1 hypothetical protein Aspvir_007801 [Aspergillus viridinutans]
MPTPSESQDQPTWPSILTTAKHTPRTSTPKPDLPSAEQQSLIDALRSLPLTNPPDSNSDADQSDLKAAIADILSEYEDEDESSTSTESRNESKKEKEQWENLHAFLAFITKESIVRLEDVGIHVLRVALERGEHHHYHHSHHQQGPAVGVPPGTGKRKKMAVFVSCAAIWALVMGEELWERRHETEEFPVGLSLSLSPSPRESGAAGDAAATVSKSRWQMWIDRFQFLSLADDLDIKTRELAAEAAAVMRRVT